MAAKVHSIPSTQVFSQFLHPFAHRVTVTKISCLQAFEANTNLGWTGGLLEGLKHSTSKYVLFANDDIFIPNCSFRWMSQMVRHLALSPQIAAVGPSSNLVMGAQNIWAAPPLLGYSASYLIGFCMLARRSTLDEVGGVDPADHVGAREVQVLVAAFVPGAPEVLRREAGGLEHGPHGPVEDEDALAEGVAKPAHARHSSARARKP